MDSIEERTTNILPTFTFWGDGIVLVTQKEWRKSARRAESVFKQLSRSKKQIIELKRRFASIYSRRNVPGIYISHFLPSACKGLYFSGLSFLAHINFPPPLATC